MNIVIIGYRCTGKTTAGKILAEELDWDFVDTDHLITLRERSDIEGIISAKGWEYFRLLEKMVIHELSEKNRIVIATGGGVVMDDNIGRSSGVRRCVSWGVCGCYRHRGCRSRCVGWHIVE